jgi:hypothetical protein
LKARCLPPRLPLDSISIAFKTDPPLRKARAPLKALASPIPSIGSLKPFALTLLAAAQLAVMAMQRQVLELCAQCIDSLECISSLHSKSRQVVSIQMGERRFASSNRGSHSDGNAAVKFLNCALNAFDSLERISSTILRRRHSEMSQVDDSDERASERLFRFQTFFFCFFLGKKFLKMAVTEAFVEAFMSAYPPSYTGFWEIIESSLTENGDSFEFKARLKQGGYVFPLFFGFFFLLFLTNSLFVLFC